MRKGVCFVLIYIFGNTAETVKPKSVNLALETVLQFDKKDHSADVEVLDRVQSFLDNIKNAMRGSKNAKRRSNDNDLKFTDFLLEATEILKKYDDNDLEDFFAVLDNQSRKYNYKGCKFYELVDNNDVRRFMSNKLEEAKDTSAKKMRRYLNDVARAISSDRFDDKHRGIINLVSSLYDGASSKFGKVLKNLRSYQTRAKDSALNLDEIVSNALRTLVFDHYSNLNDNARQQLKTAVSAFWLPNQSNGGNSDHNAHDNDDFDVQDYKSKLRVIDVPSKFSQKNGDRLKIKSLKSKSKRHKSKKSTSKIDIDFMIFKKATRKQPVAVSDEDNTKRTEKHYGSTQGLIDEPLSNSYELKKPKIINQSYKAILPTKASSDDVSDNGKDSEKSSSGDSKGKQGISIEFANEKYMSEQKRKHKKQKIGHITYDVERRLKFKSHDYTDEDDFDTVSVTDENVDSSKEAPVAKRPVYEDSNEGGVLVGGQNIHDMHYRAEQRALKPSKRKEKKVVEELSVVTESTGFTKKLRDRQKSQHKFLKKTKDKKKTTAPCDAKEESNSKTNDTKDNKDSAFASSDEGITIETFENEKYSNLRKALKPTTSSVRRLILNLERQLEDVKQRINFVTVDKVNKTDEYAQTDERDKKSDIKIKKTEENAQAYFDAEARASDKNDKAYEIQFSKAHNNISTTTTSTKTTKSDTNYTTSTLEYETDREIKPNRTTMHESTKIAIFRSAVDDTDTGKSQESEENDNVILSTPKDDKITEVDETRKTSKVDTGLNETTTMDTKTDSIFKASSEKIATKSEAGDSKAGKDSINSTKLPEESTLDKKEEKRNVQMRTTVIDLTKHLKDSDTVVVNMKDKTERKIVESEGRRESTRNLSEEMDLPEPPTFKDGKLEDPFNDLDIDLDFT